LRRREEKPAANSTALSFPDKNGRRLGAAALPGLAITLMPLGCPARLTRNADPWDNSPFSESFILE
jgi:hypothetical protein